MPNPMVLSFSPPTGESGDTITMHGRHFTGTTSVTVGGSAASFVVLDVETIVMTLPAHTNGSSYPVVVVNADGSSEDQAAVALDDSGNGLDGVYGLETLDDTPPFTTGHPGQLDFIQGEPGAVHGDGAASVLGYLGQAPAPGGRPFYGDFAACGWYVLDAFGTIGILPLFLREITPSFGGMLLCEITDFGSGPTLRFTKITGPDPAVFSVLDWQDASVATPSSRHMWGVRFIDATGDAFLYFDGVEVATTSFGVLDETARGDIDAMLLGGSIHGRTTFDELAIFDHDVAGADLIHLYSLRDNYGAYSAATKALNPSNYYHLNDGGLSGSFPYTAAVTPSSGWYVGAVAMGDGGAPVVPVVSGPSVDVGAADAFAVYAFHNSRYGLYRKYLSGPPATSPLGLFSVDPGDLTITDYGTVDPTHGGVEVEVFTWVGLTSTVGVTIGARAGGSPGDPDIVLQVATRSGGSITIGPYNAPIEFEALTTGITINWIARIDDTHFALGYDRNPPSIYAGSHIAILSVSGTTVTIDNTTPVTTGTFRVIGILDSSHLLAAGNTGSPFDLYVHTFSLGGGISATAGPFSISGAPSGTTATWYGAYKADGSGDFLMEYVTAAGSWIQPCNWDGTTINAGTPVHVASASYGGSYPPGAIDIGNKMDDANADVGGVVDRHMFISTSVGGIVICATQSGTTLTVGPTSAFTTAPPTLAQGSAPQIMFGNIAVVGTTDFATHSYLQAVRC